MYDIYDNKVVGVSHIIYIQGGNYEKFNQRSLCNYQRII